MPIMDIVIFIISLEDNIGVTVVEFAQELKILSHWLEFLNSIYFNWFFSCLSEEGLGLRLELLNMQI